MKLPIMIAVDFPVLGGASQIRDIWPGRPAARRLAIEWTAQLRAGRSAVHDRGGFYTADGAKPSAIKGTAVP
jgi:hypothetical protein